MHSEKTASWQRIFKASGYACQGLKALYIREASFRQEVWLMSATLPVIWLWPAMPLWIVAMVSMCSGGVLITEALNSALEALVDYLAPERHPEAGYIKDVGSAAVAIAFMLWTLSWAVAVAATLGKYIK